MAKLIPVILKHHSYLLKKSRRNSDPKLIYKYDVVSAVRGDDYQNNIYFAQKINRLYNNREELTEPGYRDAIDDKKPLQRNCIWRE